MRKTGFPPASFLVDSRILSLHGALQQRPPRLVDPDQGVARAAVALVLRPAADDLNILLIQRTLSPSDPWSGHMALPGGRRHGNEDLLDTAIRETREEVGIDLNDGSMLLGRLDDVGPAGGGPRIAVAPFVFTVNRDVAVVRDDREVADFVWIPLRHLADPASAAEHLYVLPTGDRRSFPALLYHHYVIWGLTYRMLTQLIAVVRSTNLEPAG